MSRRDQPRITLAKLTKAERDVLDKIIKKSWKNGRTAGRKGAFKELYDKGILRGRKS